MVKFQQLVAAPYGSGVMLYALDQEGDIWARSEGIGTSGNWYKLEAPEPDAPGEAPPRRPLTPQERETLPKVQEKLTEAQRRLDAKDKPPSAPA